MPDTSISIVIPAYNASHTIDRALQSVGAKTPGVEIIVVDDGSADSAALGAICAAYGNVTLNTLLINHGKAFAMNAGVAASTGDVVVILDADDELAPDWPSVLQDILGRWPSEAAICFAASRLPNGSVAASEPAYTGPLTFEDMLNDRHKGEYLPMFRGTIARSAGGYRDPETRRECAQWTYLSYAKKGPLWIDATVMRIYHEDQPGSLSSSLSEPEKAREVMICYDRVFEDFGHDYDSSAELNARRRRLRHAVFSALALNKSKAWSLWRGAASFAVPIDSLAALVLILIGGKPALQLVSLAKRLGLVRRYG